MDAEEIHDLRVLTRRMRATVWVARRLASSETLDRLRRRLRTLGRILGERRGLDVARRDARTYHLDGSSLEAELRSTGKALKRALDSSRRSGLERLLTEGARELARSAEDRIGESLHRRARRFREALARAPRGKSEMHELRIEAKKARYVLDAVGRMGGFLKPLQDRLGRAHDLEVLQARLGRSARAARDEKRERAAARRIMRGLVARARRELETAG